MKNSEMFERAIEVLDERGHAKEVFENLEGGVCAVEIGRASCRERV